MAEQEQEADTRVRVALRVRPFVARELADGVQSCITVDEDLKCVALGRDRRLTFDHVYGSEATQESIFEQCVRPLVDAFMEGSNATVMAYGQTGSGKTYTMGLDTGALASTSGTPDTSMHVGMTPRVVQHLFSSLETREREREQQQQQILMQTGESGSLRVSITLLEIYNEEVKDLLSPATASKVLAMREAACGTVSVSGAREVEVHGAQDLMHLLNEALAARSTSQTFMNESSSRSHAICTIMLRRASVSPGPARTRASSTSLSASFIGDDMTGTLVSKLHLVDLAGSERTKRSTGAQARASAYWMGAEAAAARFREAVNINQGLLALGNVISALGDKRRWGVTHVPYRDSKLTRLLQDSLGGNSTTTLLACVSPADDSLEESLSTLKYAHRARNIRNRPEITRASEATDSLTALQADVHALQVALMRGLFAVRSGSVSLAGASQAAFGDIAQVLAIGTDLSSVELCTEALETLGNVQLRIMAASQLSGVAGQLDGPCMQPGGGGRGTEGQETSAEDMGILRAQLHQVVTELQEARQDLKQDERIFADQQRELRVAQQTIAQLQHQSARCDSVGGGQPRTAVCNEAAAAMRELKTAVAQETAGTKGMNRATGDAVVVVAGSGGFATLALGSKGPSEDGPARDGFNSGAAGAAPEQSSDDSGAMAKLASLENAGTAQLVHHDDAQLELLALMAGDCARRSAEEVDEEVVLLGEVSEASSVGRLRITGQIRVLSADAEHHSLLAELAAVQAQRDALEAERVAAEAAQQQQRDDFAAVRDVLEERMRYLSGSIASQEALIEALTAQEAQARQLNKLCMERMATLEEEIAAREGEVSALREALLELEGDLVARTTEEREQIRRQCEDDIAKAQVQISSLRRALQDAHLQRIDRDTQRSAARVHTLESELKVLRSEQESLRRRLTERITAQERQSRSHNQEMTLLRRAAHTAQQRLATLIEENRVNKAMAKAKGEEAVSAQKRVQQLQQELEACRSPGSLRSPTPPPHSRAATPCSGSRLAADAHDNIPKATQGWCTGKARAVQTSPLAGSPSKPVPWSSSRAATPPATMGSGRMASNGSRYQTPVQRATSVTPASPMVDVEGQASEIAPAEVQLLLEHQVRAITAKQAAEQRIQRLETRQRHLVALKEELQAERSEILAALSVARAGRSANVPGHTRHNSRYASYEDEIEGFTNVERPSPRTAMSPSVHQQRQQQQLVQQQQAALADVDDRLDAVSADTGYVDMVFQEMRSVVQRADGCGLELRRRLARMNTADTRSALYAALEALAAARQAGNRAPPAQAVSGNPAPVPLQQMPSTAPVPTTISSADTQQLKVATSTEHPHPSGRWSMLSAEDSQPLHAAPRSPQRTTNVLSSPRSPRHASPSRFTASTERSIRPPLRQSLFLVDTSVTALPPTSAAKAESVVSLVECTSEEGDKRNVNGSRSQARTSGLLWDPEASLSHSVAAGTDRGSWASSVELIQQLNGAGAQPPVTIPTAVQPCAVLGSPHAPSWLGAGVNAHRPAQLTAKGLPITCIDAEQPDAMVGRDAMIGPRQLPSTDGGAPRTDSEQVNQSVDWILPPSAQVLPVKALLHAHSGAVSSPHVLSPRNVPLVSAKRCQVTPLRASSLQTPSHHASPGIASADMPAATSPSPARQSLRSPSMRRGPSVSPAGSARLPSYALSPLRSTLARADSPSLSENCSMMLAEGTPF